MGSSSSDRGRRRGVLSGAPPARFLAAYHELRLCASRAGLLPRERKLGQVCWLADANLCTLSGAAQPATLPRPTPTHASRGPCNRRHHHAARLRARNLLHRVHRPRRRGLLGLRRHGADEDAILEGRRILGGRALRGRGEVRHERARRDDLAEQEKAHRRRRDARSARQAGERAARRGGRGGGHVSGSGRAANKERARERGKG